MSGIGKRAVVISTVIAAFVGLGLTNATEASASTSAGINAANYAVKNLLNKPYSEIRQHGTGPTYYDCSGLVQKAFKSGGNRYLPRTTDEQWRYLRNKGTASKTHVHTAQKGDILFFWNNGSVQHVGIYIGSGKMIDANSTQGHSKIESAFYNWGFDYITHGWVK